MLIRSRGLIASLIAQAYPFELVCFEEHGAASPGSPMPFPGRASLPISAMHSLRALTALGRDMSYTLVKFDGDHLLGRSSDLLGIGVTRHGIDGRTRCYPLVPHLRPRWSEQSQD